MIGFLKTRRPLVLFVLVIALVIVVNLAMGTPFTVRLLVEATAYGLIALGLNIQFGYGGLFNFGIMGFVMIGGFSSVFISYPVNQAFWVSDGSMMLGRALVAFIAGLALVWGARKLPLTGGWRTAAIILAWIIAYIAYLPY